MVLPCGRSANTEAGWMKGAGKLCYVFQPIQQEPELMYKIYDGIFTSFEQLENKFLIFGPVSPVERVKFQKMEMEMCECGHEAPIGFIVYDEDNCGTCMPCAIEELTDKLQSADILLNACKSAMPQPKNDLIVNSVSVPVDNDAVEFTPDQLEKFVIGFTNKLLDEHNERKSEEIYNDYYQEFKKQK